MCASMVHFSQVPKPKPILSQPAHVDKMIWTDFFKLFEATVGNARGRLARDDELCLSPLSLCLFFSFGLDRFSWCTALITWLWFGSLGAGVLGPRS